MVVDNFQLCRFSSIAKILQYHHMTGPLPSGGLNLGVGGSHDHSDLSDAIIEANDTLLEQVVRIYWLNFLLPIITYMYSYLFQNNLLDEVTGVRKANQSLPGVDSKQVRNHENVREGVKS